MAAKRPAGNGKADFRRIGWNGVRISVPVDWRLDRIGADYLFFEAQGIPRMELRWGRPAGRIGDPRKFARRALDRLGRRHQVVVTPWAPPQNWLVHLGGFRPAGFAWKGEAAAARGLVLSCPFCRTVSCIQFFDGPGHPDRNPAPWAPTVLASFGDHPPGDRVLWSVFDIHAWLPEGFSLRAQRFDVGRFEIRLQKGRLNLTLYRWAMASERLRAAPLHQWAEPIGMRPAPVPVQGGGEGRFYLEWETRVPRSLRCWSGGWMRLRLAHLPERDRVLGMALSCTGPEAKAEVAAMDALWKSYALSFP